MKLLLFASLLSIYVRAEDTLSCDKLTVGGSAYNLSALNKDREIPLPKISTPPTTKTTLFILNPCGKISPKAGGCQDAWLCEQISYKFPDDDKERTTNLISFAKDKIEKVDKFNEGGKTGLVLTYKGEKYEEIERNLNLKLICDKEQKDTSALFHYVKIEDGTLFLEWTGNLACPGVADENNPASKSSTIGTFFLVLFIIFCFYMFGGVIYNIFIMKENRFPDYVPNHEFWARLYDTIGEGFSKLFGRVSGGRYVSL